MTARASDCDAPDMEEPGTHYVKPSGAAGEGLERSSGGVTTLEVIRKKVLLQILAVREAERLGITATPEEVISAAAGFRNMFQLTEEDEFRSWLERESIPSERFERVMYQFATVARVENFYAAEIERQVSDMSRIDAAKSRAH